MQHDEPKRHLGSEMGRILLYFHPGGGYSTISLRSSMTHFVNYCNPRMTKLTTTNFSEEVQREEDTPEERRVNFRKDTLADVCKTVLKGLSEDGAVDLCLCLFDPLPP